MRADADRVNTRGIPDGATVVAAVDGTRAADGAARWAADYAARHSRRLTLAYVVTPTLLDEQNPQLRVRIRRWRDHRARQMLADVRAHIALSTTATSPTIDLELRFGAPASELTEMSGDAALLVVGSRFHGSAGGPRLGSVSAAVSYRARCPVAVVHRYDNDMLMKPLVVGIDGSPASEAATAIAFDEASRRGVDLIAVHAWSDVGVIPMFGMDWYASQERAAEVVAERLAGWQEKYPDVAVERRILCDVPAHDLQAESRRAGLVVVGSRGRGAARTLALGSVATAVAEGTDVR